MFSRRGFEGKEIFSIPFAEFIICYVIYSSHKLTINQFLPMLIIYEKSLIKVFVYHVIYV